VGPGGSIKKGYLDHEMVCFGVGLWFSNGKIGKESLVPAADIVTLGATHSTIFHMLGPSSMSHIDIPAPLPVVRDHTLEFSISSHEV